MVAIERQSERARPARSPDAIPAGARRRTASPRQVFAACALGALVLSLFASGDLPSWADRLRDGALTPLAREVAIGWNDRLAPLGLTRPHRELHRALEWLRSRQWP
jgi:hypothetical protein